MDSDGENFMPLTTAGTYAAPAFMGSENLVYTKETDAAGRLTLMSFVTGRRELAMADTTVVGDAGITIAKDRPRIAFVTKTEGADADIGVNDLLVVKHLFTLKLPGWQGEPTFSHDSRNLAFLSDSGKARQITIVDIDGKNARTLAGEDRYKHIAWSPQKAQLAFVRETPTGDELGLINVADASSCTLLAAPKINRPSWSPNGSHLLIARTDGDGIEIVNVATRKRSKIATGRGTVRHTAWSGVWP